MSDNAKSYRAIKDELNKLYPSQPHGNVAIHLKTMAGMVNGSLLTGVPDIN